MTPVPVMLSSRTRRRDAGMPCTGPLVDTLGRIHDDLRLSVTDRCNLRCTYCMPMEGLRFLPPKSLLTFDELTRVATVATQLGVTTIRLTGGEPLLRANLHRLVARLVALDLDDLSLTTNGMLLAREVPDLVAAGLTRVNISCDSLRPDRFAAIRRRGDLATVLGSMDAAERAGLPAVKVNVVLERGVNDDEILEFAEFARTTGRAVRFIEFMPLDAQGTWRRDRLVPGSEVLARIGARWPLVPVVGADPHAPAERFRFVDGVGEIGVVSSVTAPFCGSCNRLRLTADGAVRNCLFSDDELDARAVLRSAESDDRTLGLLLRRAVWGKRPGHGMDDPGFLPPSRSMSMIGG